MGNGQNCTKTKLHERTKLHEGKKFQEENFAPRVVFDKQKKKKNLNKN